VLFPPPAVAGKMRESATARVTLSYLKPRWGEQTNRAVPRLPARHYCCVHFPQNFDGRGGIREDGCRE
jgi:hypothetical protein